MSCATDRSPPSTPYLFADPHPAMISPTIDTTENAMTYSSPSSRSRSTSVGLDGIVTQMTKLGTNSTSGAIQYTHRSTQLGMMSSLPMSFTTSATGWSTPCGPTRIGPMRICSRPRYLRSSSTSEITTTDSAPSSSDSDSISSGTADVNSHATPLMASHASDPAPSRKPLIGPPRPGRCPGSPAPPPRRRCTCRGAAAAAP